VQIKEIEDTIHTKLSTEDTIVAKLRSRR